MSTLAPPRPLDHLVLPTADLAVARERLTAVGFTVAPIGIHPFGTENACIYLADGTFLEPLATGDAGKVEEAASAGNVFVARDRQFRRRNGAEGFSAVVFGTGNADNDHASFVRAGISAGDRLDFSRPFVDASGRADEASFRLAFAAEGGEPDAFFFTCERANVPQVDRSALQAHANGATRIAAVFACVEHPAAHARFFETVAGAPANVVGGRLEVELANAAIQLLDPADFVDEFGPDAPATAALRLAAVEFQVPDLAPVERHLAATATRYQRRDARLIVPAAPGQGAIFVFKEFS